jgi:hypothetical protein
MAELKIPKTDGACADMLYRLREKRLKLQREADAVKADEAVLTAHLLNNLSANDAEGVKGKVASVNVLRKTTANAKDWDKFFAWMKKDKRRFALMGKRLNDKACREQWEANKVIPGIEQYRFKKLSLTKK